MMKKYEITTMQVESYCDAAPEITIKLFATDNEVSSSDVEILKKSIEGIVCPDNGFRYVDYSSFYSGRGNGKSNWRRTFADAVMRREIEDKEKKKFEIKRVILHNPATIIFWADGTKTVVKCQDGDVYSPETGLAMCYMKKALGNKSNFNNTFKKHIPEQSESVDNGKKKSTKTYSHLNSEAVYRILRENKSSVAELARSVGVDKSAVYTWLRGGGVKRRNISKLVKVLHVPEEVIIKEEK